MRRITVSLCLFSLLACGVLLVTTQPAAAAVPAATIYYGCVTTATGAIRIVTATTTCKSTEHKIQWDQTGPQGPAGPAGPQGPKGATGAQGTGWTSRADWPHRAARTRGSIGRLVRHRKERRVGRLSRSAHSCKPEQCKPELISSLHLHCCCWPAATTVSATSPVSTTMAPPTTMAAVKQAPATCRPATPTCLP